MNILLIHESFALPSEPGGTRHYELAAHLVSRGHQFTVITSGASYLTGDRLPSAGSSLTGLSVLRTRAPVTRGRTLGSRALGFASFALAAAWRGIRVPVAPDVVVGTTPSLSQALAAWLVAACRRRPFVLEVRDLWPAFLVGMGVLQNRLLIGVLERVEQFLYRRAAVIIINSPAYRGHLLSCGVPADRIRLVANGVDAANFDPESQGAAIRAELGLADSFVVTYAGALGLANDIPTLLRAAHQLSCEPRIHLVLVGDGRERSRLESMAESMRLTNVTFAGPRSKREMPEMLAAADACVAVLQNIPDFRTTYPNKVFDYLAAGRPVIVAIDGAIRQVVEEAHAGVFVTPGDPVALAEAIGRLARDPEGCKRMGAAGREYVQTRFERARQARRFEEAISPG